TAGASVLTTLDQVETSFVAPSVADNSAQTIVIQLQVTDLDQPPLISEPISVTIHITPISTTVNTRPTACINDRSIAGVEVDETGSEPPYVRTEVILEGSCSDDGDSDVVQPLTYLWTNNEPDLELQTGDRSATYRFLAPDVSSADLEGRRTVEVRLTVNDGQAENAESVAAIATVNVRFVNRIPTISLGPDREDVNEGDDVQVRAEVSDPDGQPVTVTWRQVLPPGPSVTFTQDEEVDGRLLHFTANQVASDTSVVFEATASDGTRSSTDSIEITIHNLPGPTAPLLQGPSDGSVFAPTRLFLRWDGSSGGTGSVSYTVLFGTEDPPLAEAPGCQNLTTDLHCVIGSLAPNTTYHWQVRARDSFGNATLSSSSSINTDNSLVAWWLFADGPNSSIVVDSSGGGHIGTLNNIDPMTGWVGTPGVFDWTLDFGGLNSFVLVPGSPAFSIGGGDFTVSARINPRVLDGDHRVLLANQTVNNFQLAIDNGGASAGRLNFNGGGAPFVQSDPLAWDLTRGRWYDVTLTRGSGLVTFYRDIVAAGSGRVDAAVGDTTDLNIGYRASTGNHPFEGLIDEIAIYNKSLSPAELQNNYCSIQALAAIDPLPPACE
ncbi:MAG: LamG-like jellyroll fold domain-containing protein, partial [Deltaproteobacteria bacterium]|nr:LamG-like jellyroll fold domain-containing protein [Deltaproteobacteria bacterium]